MNERMPWQAWLGLLDHTWAAVPRIADFVCARCVQAPGYFSVVQRAMDFTTLGRQVQAGTYGTWGAVLADLELMFTNATRYNPPDSVYHKQAGPL